MSAGRRRLAATLLAALLLAGAARAAEPVAVAMANASRATRCAEEDNVYVTFAGAGIAGFRLAVRHPDYIGDIDADSTAPDFSRCDMSQDPSYPFVPRDVTLYDDGRYRLVGHAFKTNWRPESVPFHVAGKEERGLHLVQLFKYVDGVPIEIVVLYPADGYWRAKPLPPPNLAESAYGSSFLIGPIDEDGRPYVALDEVDFDPATLAFRVRFARGGEAILTVADARADGLNLDISFAPAAAADRPFAALRSMYVTDEQADVADVAWRSVAGDATIQSILDVTGGPVTQARFGRATKSLHNTSAPDYVFEGFRAATP